jgi:secreted PhoX family phosphatase
MRRRALLAGFSLLALVAARRGVAQTAVKLDDTVAAGYQRIVIARWGDAVLPEAPPFIPAALTGAQADTQFPYDAVIAALITPPLAQDGIPRLVLVTANPTAPARMMFAPGSDNPDVAGREQGVTVMNLQYLSGRWVSVDGGYQTRRLADGTLCQISGPATVAVGGSVQGILAVQDGCATPWNTVLLAEGDATSWLTRLGGVGYGYADPTSATRFGWVVEFDAMDPGSIPVKRTALGRIARAGIAATATADGRPVVFFTQDDPAGCLFRFIGAGPGLDAGTLAVARVTGGTLAWADLGADIPTLAGLAGAAQEAAGTPFNAPGGLALGNGVLYLAAADGVTGFTTGDFTARTFAATPVVSLRAARRVNVDASGRLWIGTDQNGDTTTADGLYALEDGVPQAVYLAPLGAALGGAAFDAGTSTIFAAVRHPGATPSASYNFPATRWPTFQPGMPPQSTIIGLVPA